MQLFSQLILNLQKMILLCFLALACSAHVIHLAPKERYMRYSLHTTLNTGIIFLIQVSTDEWQETR
jgi:hypothetical protein